MSDWELVEDNEWEVSPSIENEISSQKKSFGHKLPGWLLGLGQGAEDTLFGMAKGGSEPEVDFPDTWKHPRLRSENKPQQTDATFNLEQYVNPDEMTQFNVGRYGPAVGSALYTGGRSLHGVAKGLTSKSIGNKIVEDFRKNKRLAEHKYGEVFKNAEKEGVNKIPLNLSTKDKKLFKENFSTKQEKLLQDLLANPTLKNTHEFKSNLKSLVRKLTTNEKTKGLDGTQRKALKVAEKTIEKIDQNILKAMTEKGPSKLPSQYEGANQWYAKEQGPYLDNPYIRRAELKPTEKGAIDPKRLPSKLALESGDPFRAAMGHKYPEMPINRALTNKYVYGTLGIGGIYELSKLLGGKG